MENKIKAVIISKKRIDPASIIDRRYDAVWLESGFDIDQYESDEDILEKLWLSKGFDVIVTLFSKSDYKKSGLGFEDYFADKFKSLYALGDAVFSRWIVEEDTVSPEKIGADIINKFFVLNQTFGHTKGMISVITPCYNTPEFMFKRLYDSIKSQSYTNWEWNILDDSTDGQVEKMVNEARDFRIHCFKNVTDHGNVGMNKRVLGMASRGEFILEADHDDELLPGCFETIAKAFWQYKDCGFLYSNTVELSADGPVYYGEGWSFGQGQKAEVSWNGKTYASSFTPDINEISIRTILGAPNHFRCWRKSVYDKLNGHNYNYSIVDDFELIVRTFLATKFCYVHDYLYIQHRENETTQNVRNLEIQRCNSLVKEIYDRRIHNRIIELGYKDSVWDNQKECSSIGGVHPLIEQKFNETYGQDKD